MKINNRLGFLVPILFLISFALSKTLIDEVFLEPTRYFYIPTVWKIASTLVIYIPVIVNVVFSFILSFSEDRIPWGKIGSNVKLSDNYSKFLFIRVKYWSYIIAIICFLENRKIHF